MHAFKGTFTAAVATGNQTVTGIVDETGTAFTPKWIFLWTTYGTTGAFTDGCQISMGSTDGTTSAASALVSNDNLAARSQGLQSTDLFNMCSSTALTLTRRGTFVSFGSGQFVINWVTQDGVAAVIHYIALGGTDLTAIQKSMRVDGCSPVTIAAVKPVATFGHMGIQQAGASVNISWWLSQALASGVVPQGICNIAMADSAGTSQNRKFQSGLRCFAQIGAGSGGFNIEGGLGPLGPGYDTAGNNVPGAILGATGFGGIGAMAGSGNARTTAGTTAVTGCGFAPKLVILVMDGNITSSTIVNDLALCIGAADRTRQGMAYAGSVNAVNPTQAAIDQNTTSILESVTVNATGSSSTRTSVASVSSLDADGFTLNWTTVDATAREYIWLALGDAATGGGGGVGASATFFGGA